MLAEPFLLPGLRLGGWRRQVAAVYTSGRGVDTVGLSGCVGKVGVLSEG